MKKTRQQILRLIVFLSLIFSSQFLEAQVVPNIDWVQHYVYRDSVDNSASAIDADNNVYVAGYGFTGIDKDLVVIKYDSLGNQIWVDTYDNGGDDEGMGIKVDASGNVYVVATSYDATSGLDIVTRVYNSSGTVIMHDRFDGGSNGTDVAADIEVNKTTGDFFVIGSSFVGFDFNVTVLKFNSGLSLDWGSTYNSGFDDTGVGMSVMANNDVYCTARIYDGTEADAWTFMVDNSGSKYGWDNFVGQGSGGDDEPQDMVLSGTDAVICGKLWDGANFTWDAFTRRIDASGNTVWHKDYDSVDVMNYATSLVRDSIGNIGVTGLALGSSGWEYHTLMYDSTGVFLWPQANKEQTNLWGALVEPRIAVDSVAHHFYVSGSKQNSTSDVMVYQITPFSGNTKWKQYYDGPLAGADYGTGIAVSGLGIVYLSANCENSVPGFNQTTIRLSQTPEYFPIDPYYEQPPADKAYYRNTGQLISTSGSSVPKVEYYNNMTSPEYYIQKDMVNYVFTKADTVTSTVDTLERIDVRFAESNQLTRIYNFEPTGTNLNYFLPHCGSGITNVEGYKKLFIPNIYHNIDLHYYSNHNGIKYFFVVKPNTPVTDIKLAISGAQSTNLSTGNLYLNGKLDTVNIGEVFAYNAIPVGPSTSYTTPVSASWNSLGSNQYGFTVSSYTAAAPLVIVVAVPNNPSITYPTIQNMEYSTFYGSSNNEEFTHIKVDDNTNNRYVAGSAGSGAFPPVNSITPYNNLLDAVLLKYSGTDSLRYATFYGGSGQDWAIGTTVKSNGNVYLVGYTRSTDLTINSSIRTGADQQTANGWLTTNSLSTKEDGFILEISGNGLVPAHKWSRYVGGVLGDILTDITIDKNDNLYIVGASNSCNYPTKNAYKTGGAGCQFGNNSDMVITKMDSACVLAWSTYFGGDATLQQNPPSGPWVNRDGANACDVDSLGRLYIIGSAYASSDKTPVNNTSNTTATSIFNSVSDGNGAVLLRLDSPGNTISIGMYTEVGYNYTTIKDVKVMKNQKILLCGNTNDTIQAFPLKVKSGSYNRSIPGNTTIKRGFFSLLDTNMTNLWTTHFNVQKTNSVLDLRKIAVCDNGSFMLGGVMKGDSLTFPSSSPPNVYTKASSSGQNFEAFLSYFYDQNGDYLLEHSHFLGGSGDEEAHDIDAYKSSKLYIVGKTKTSDFPVASTPANVNLIDPTFNGNNGSEDGYVTRFDLSAVLISVKEVKGNDINSIKAFPNPAHDEFFIDVSNIEKRKNLSVTVYDLTGKLVYSNKISNLNEDLFKVNCQNWSRGLYIVSLISEERRYVGKVIKE